MLEPRHHPRHPHAVHAHHGHGAGSTLKTAAHATLHCLTGCAIGEAAGLMIANIFQLSPWPTIALATLLSYASGITLGLLPVRREQHVGWLAALKIIWIGEVVSIGVMEIAMNLVDYSTGSMGAKSIASWLFWRGLMFAIPAGFLAAWPVNYWLLKRELKACH